ncbi:MAG TPA: winged helix-turn-helix domain-containing protein [Terriglobia bacterium]|nr:winged helix-turn-helix domain-containing protein [Terriglobia bacterium]
MPEAAPSLQIVRFGVFELDLRAGELRKQGLKIKLQERPLQILALLLENPGQVVTREELRQQLWPADTFVDFDHSVNTAVNKLREALGDSAENPRFIETLPRHGYRFIGAVDAGAEVRNGREGVTPPEGSERRRWFAVAAVAAVVLFGTLFILNVAGLRNRLLSSIGASHGAPLPKIESIAVLPLENLSGDPNQEYFADGMTEELITDLGKISALRVISRTSVMQYKGAKKPLPEIARELNVDAIVEAAVLRSGDRVRITAKLVGTNPERQLWAATYQRDLRDVLALQSDVALVIANHVQAELTPRERTQMAAPHPVNPQAYTAYLRGLYENNKDNEQGYKKSAEYFQQAIELDPDYAPAYAELAGTYAQMGNTELLSPHEAYPKAEAAALRALEIDGTLGPAHGTLCLIAVRYHWNWLRAEAEARRAIELSPNSGRLHRGYGWYLILMGRWAQAREEIQKGQILDPLTVFNQTALGDLYYASHQFDRAVEQLQKTVVLFATDPGTAYPHSMLAKAYMGKGMFEAAIAEQQKALTIFGESHLYLAMLGDMYGAAGKKAEALKILNQLEEQSKRKYVSPYDIALVYIGLGDKDQALACLEKAYQAHANEMTNLKVDPMLDSLRSDSRFQDILRRMNFPP